MTFARVHNGRPIDRAKVPRLGLDELRHVVTRARADGKRVVSLFGARPAADAAARAVELVAVLANDAESHIEAATAMLDGDAFPSMATECPEVHLFEREIAEQWGIVPRGHPWLKPVRFVRSFCPEHDAWDRPKGTAPTVGVMDFYRVEGEEIHEVAVGPVHAGVIEPGHFRFQCYGEHVFHLEISLGYQHRGIERALVGGPTKRTLPYMETLAGDTTIGHTTAYCQIIEALAGLRVPARAHTLRALALELERLANHTGGLAGLANDVGFLPTASYCGRLRGDFLNMTALICGSRFGRGLVRPGGVGFDVDVDRIAELKRRMVAAARDVKDAVELLWDSASVMARFEGTGAVAPEVASALGLVGVAARACGIERDVRRDHPTGFFRVAHIPVSVWHTGDVFARAYVRWLEIERSCAFVLEHLARLPSGAVRADGASLTPRLRPDQLCVSIVEGWRGEICHEAMTDASGRLCSYKVTDPSFHNWAGLSMALRDEAISDFPLCDKSFDLSYCGHDL